MSIFYRPVPVFVIHKHLLQRRIQLKVEKYIDHTSVQAGLFVICIFCSFLYRFENQLYIHVNVRYKLSVRKSIKHVSLVHDKTKNCIYT